MKVQRGTVLQPREHMSIAPLKDGPSRISGVLRDNKESWVSHLISFSRRGWHFLSFKRWWRLLSSCSSSRHKCPLSSHWTTEQNCIISTLVPVFDVAIPLWWAGSSCFLRFPTPETPDARSSFHDSIKMWCFYVFLHHGGCFLCVHGWNKHRQFILANI